MNRVCVSLLEWVGNNRRGIGRYRERAESTPRNDGVSEKGSRLIGMKSIIKDRIEKNFVNLDSHLITLISKKNRQRWTSSEPLKIKKKGCENNSISI